MEEAVLSPDFRMGRIIRLPGERRVLQFDAANKNIVVGGRMCQ